MKYVVQGRHETERGLHVELWPVGMVPGSPRWCASKVREVIFPEEKRESVDTHFAMHSLHDEEEFIEVAQPFLAPNPGLPVKGAS